MATVGGRTCAAMTMELLAVGSTVHSMTLSYSQLPALRGFPEGPAEAARHRTRRGSLGIVVTGRTTSDSYELTPPFFGPVARGSPMVGALKRVVIVL